MPDQFISSLNNIENPLGSVPEILPNTQGKVAPEIEKIGPAEENTAVVPPTNPQEVTEQKTTVVDATTPEITTTDVRGDKNTTIANELEKELITTIHNLPNDKS